VLSPRRDSWGVYRVFGKRPFVSRLFIFGCRGLMSERGGGGANMTDRACQRLDGDVLWWFGRGCITAGWFGSSEGLVGVGHRAE
jgi:hypothetical protein